MIYHVYNRAKLYFNNNDLFIATCDQQIFDYSKSIGAKIIMTSKKHQRASDRVYEAMKKIEKNTVGRKDMKKI